MSVFIRAWNRIDNVKVLFQEMVKLFYCRWKLWVVKLSDYKAIFSFESVPS